MGRAHLSLIYICINQYITNNWICPYTINLIEAKGEKLDYLYKFLYPSLAVITGIKQLSILQVQPILRNILMTFLL